MASDGNSSSLQTISEPNIQHARLEALKGPVNSPEKGLIGQLAENPFFTAVWTQLTKLDKTNHRRVLVLLVLVLQPPLLKKAFAMLEPSSSGGY